MGLTKTAITRPVFILMLMFAALLLGYISFKSMRVEQNPDVSFGVITVSTVYPGASPDEINTLISRKVEEAVSGVNGLREVTSSSQEGISIVTANFNIGTDMDSALNDARSKIDAIVSQLPQDVQKPTLTKFDTTSTPVLYMVASNPKLSSRELRDLMDNKVKDRFERIDGVASIGVTGGDVRELQVRLKKDKLLAYGIGINQIQRAVQAATLNVPSGRVVAGPLEYNVRVLGEFKTVEDLANLVLSITDPSNPQAPPKIVPLRDVAEVSDTVEEKTSRSRLDGHDAVVLVVQKAHEGNAVEISKAADDVIKGVQADYGITLTKTLDQATTISESLADLQFSLFFGIFLVAAIVYLFLHNFRGMLIVSIAIPICLMAAFIAMKLFGFTINNLSMLALSLAVGVLVDDAIVVLENIYRHLRMGEKPRDAAINGRSEIGLAAIAITMADVVVFLPIGFMGGIVGQFFKPLGIGFAVTVLISLFVSFTVTPMLASRWYREGEDVEHPTGRFAQWFERRFDKLANNYRRGLEWALNHRWFVFIAGFTILMSVFMLIGGSFAPNATAAIKQASGMTMFATIIGVIVFVANIFRGYIKPQFILYGFLFGLAFPAGALLGNTWAHIKGEQIFKFAFFPPSDQGQVAISIELPPGASLDATDAVVKRVEAVASQDPDAKYVLANVGSQGGGGGGFGTSSSGSNLATVSVTLYDKLSILDRMPWAKHKERLRTRSDESVAADLLQKVGRIPGANIKINAQNGFGGSAIQMSFAGEDRDLLVKTVNNIREKLRQGAIKGVINPDISSKPGKPELPVIPDRAKLASLGLTVNDIAGALRIMYQGNFDTKFRQLGQEYNIRVMLDLADRNDPNVLGQVPVTFVQGRPVFLPEVAQIVTGTGVDKIDRRDRTEEVRLTADLLPGNAAGSVQQEMNKWLATEHLVPEGVRIKPLGQADLQQRETGYLFGALGIGFILVYMLLASLFDNLLYPFIIQLAQPQAMVGALLALMITDKTFNIVGFIGIITLVGLVGKNAILIVDYTNTLRGRGHNRHDALAEAGPTRLRPIMMTTLALILGIMPVALALGRGSEFRDTIGITIIGGITLSTMLTLFVIPCSYTIFDDFSLMIGRIMNRGKKKPPTDDSDIPVEAGITTDPVRAH